MKRILNHTKETGKMVVNKIQKSVFFTIATVFSITVLLLGSDSPNKAISIIQKNEKEPSKLLKIAEGLPKSTLILLNKFDSISNEMDIKLDAVNNSK